MIAFPSTTRSRQAFTLIELLVACSVLAILVVMFAQMAGSVANSYRNGKSRSDANAIGRAVLDALDGDIRQLIVSPDLMTFKQSETAEASSLKFYCRRPGIFHAAAPASSGMEALRSASVVEYVSYRSAEKRGYLSRRDMASTWSSSATIIPLGTTDTIADLNADNGELCLYRGVLAFDWRYLRADGSMDKTDDLSRPIVALRISLAVIDEDALRLLKHLNRLNDMMDVFPTDSASSSGVVEWEKKLRQKAADFPPQTVQAVRLYERFIRIPQSN